MRQVIAAATAAFVAGGIATGAALSLAQPTPPSVPITQDQAPAPDGWPPGRMMHHGMMHQMREGGPVDGFRALALVYREKDRNLSPADVQKIAEAFLVWNGNHTWKVANVASASDGQIGFNLTTQDGSVVAKFSMDPHTARLTRVG